jgi:sister chromatid cohesion protein DCC1
MSTQSTTSIPFSISHPQEHVRLLELPPELLALIEAESSTNNNLVDRERDMIYADLGGRVQLKSALTNDFSTATKPKEEYLHVCTEDKVWAVRQVSTSNSVHVLRPNLKVPVLSGDESDPTAASGPGVTAIAQPTSTLELLPVAFTQKDIEAALRRLLPTISSNATKSSIASNISDKEIIASLPYPLHPILRAQRELFIITPFNKPCIPAPEILLAAWKALFALGRKFPLDTSDMIYLGERSMQIHQEEGEVVACAVRAIAERFVDLNSEDSDSEDSDPEDGELRRLRYSLEGMLMGKETCVFVGQLLVRCAGEQGLKREELQERWADIVPSSWKKWCKVDALGEACAVDSEGTIRWHEVEGPVSEGSGARSAEAIPSTVAGKRNWHEKFSAQRKKTK